MEDPKITYKKLSEIIPYENNPRHNDTAVEYVSRSIKEFGFNVPIVVDKNNVIITGHTRYKASKELGLHEVPCIVADWLTEDQAKAFRIVDNKTSELSTWDYDLLGKAIDNVSIDLEYFGMIEAAIDWKLFDETKEEHEKEHEEVDETYRRCPACGGVGPEEDFERGEN